MSAPLPPKKEVALALLERSSVHLHLDPRAPGVVVPAWFKKQPQLVLQIGLNMPVPIPDLRLDEEGMSCTLSFNRAPFFCVVPWSSIYAMVGDDGRGMVWPDDVPPEVAQQARGREGEATAAATAKKGSPKRVAEVAARGREMAGSREGAGEKGEPRNADATPLHTDAAEGALSKPKKSRKRSRPGADSMSPNGLGGTDSHARAGLIAVPSLAGKREVPLVPQAAPQRAQKSEGAPPPPPRIVPGPKRPNAAPRTKRELPPYLRVVK
jgi:stringent starvation protein B